MLSSELVRSALESAPDAMVIADATGIIVFANQQVTALFGYAPWELTGQKVECLLPERFRSRHVGHREGFNGEVRVRPMGAGLDLFARRRDGTEFPVEISLSPISDDGRVLVAAAIRDVTERKRIEAELVAARESADRANQAKSRFLATASHDLRQPLQTLALLNGTLRRTVRDVDATEAVVRQEHAIAAMSRLLNTLLDISKLESGAIKPEPTDFVVETLFEELREEFAGLASDKGLELRVETCNDRAHSDPSLVEQILRNLLANAIKYTHVGHVSIRCQRDVGVIRVQVLDTGIGIAPDQLPLIYDEFYQAGVPANSVREGYGLGLSIVQRLVRLLELRLGVESELGKGSTFSLDLPAGMERTRAAATRAAKTRLEPAAPPRPSPHVLIVEDDPAVLDATRMLFRVEGFRASVAASLAEAAQKSAEHADINVLVTDYHLADGETGTDVIGAVRKILGRDVGVVLVTGDTSAAMKDLQHDERVRMTSKPLRAEELLALVRSLLPS
ncbi:MAG TPA: PAS domain S-box protein [Steroidobacteraceae bacterium]|nr:PAS domain S-box protein [Steroidobacteraceae bacterium]